MAWQKVDRFVKLAPSELGALFGVLDGPAKDGDCVSELIGASPVAFCSRFFPFGNQAQNFI